uniref:Phosphoglycerate mutase n=1 Tax=Tetraselmis chuii TaxID=63592 RepID=A0A7S1SG49_9CHLO|mmetsp:Transcript_10/g.25  ORF Transcript_10/g.25 Transcript_10/m.25 type:complete len:200 (+) Transcript_10:392-991(+)
MKNSYWVLRHGRSKANEAGVIVSSLNNGVKVEYALSEAGKQQAVEAGRQLAGELTQRGLAPSSLQIYSSPFSRTVETAELVATELGLPVSSVVKETDLRERYFGTALELQSHDLYAGVWEVDMQDVSQGPAGGGESVKAVSTRLSGLLDRLEEAHEGETILLVAHGDTLSILTTTVKGGELGSHREWGLKTAELSLLVP